MTLIEDSDYFIRIVPLPHAIRGMVSPNEDGTFSIYINSRNTYNQDIIAKQHEINHILNDDFYGDKSIQDIEDVI